MEKPDQMTVNAASCLSAAERVRKNLVALVEKIEQSRNPACAPEVQLPVDIFLADMNTRKNAPRVILKPRMLRNELWTQSIVAYVYGGIENAFTKGAMMIRSTQLHRRWPMKFLSGQVWFGYRLN